MNERLQALIDEHGKEAVAAAVEKMVAKPIPRISSPLVSDDSLQATLLQLDTSVTDILKAGDANEAAYQAKAELMKKARLLETDIQLTESEAIMAIQGTGKDAFGIITDADGKEKKVTLSNDTQRDAYRRFFSQKARKELADVEAEIRRIDVEMARAKDAYNAKQEAINCIRVKATLQANVLAFLK